MKQFIRKSSIVVLSMFIAVLITSRHSSGSARIRQYASSSVHSVASDILLDSPLPLPNEMTPSDDRYEIMMVGSGGRTGIAPLFTKQVPPLMSSTSIFSTTSGVPSMGFFAPPTQVISVPPMIADGQFVWGPNVGNFNIKIFLESRDSGLAPFAKEIDLWASYTSVNPKILLAVLELRYEMVDGLSSDLSSEEIITSIQETADSLAVAFYTHLYTWGAHGSQDPSGGSPPSPEMNFSDGTQVILSEDVSSGSFAIAAHLASTTDREAWAATVDEKNPASFLSVFKNLFPDVDLLAETNDIIPPDLPPDDLFQMPFPLGSSWRFGGPHSWRGDDTRPFSSMDFHAGGGTCEAPPRMFSVAAASGPAIRPNDHTCWLEIAHAGGWTTSYYHLQKLIDPQGAQMEQNASVGKIACEICAGGWANGPHLHWSVKYNGAYVSLEGIQISGWTIHVGPEAYSSGSIEREGATLDPWSTVLNDYFDYFPIPNRSLQFYGNGVNDIDRVKILLGKPRRPIDIGGGNFTIEWWMKANSGENSNVGCSTGNDQWIYGSIIFDRDIHGDGDYGDYGISLMNNRIAFGVNNGSAGETLCGATDVADGNWHHVAVTRQKSTGQLRLFVDGQLDAEIIGPTGKINYNFMRTTGYPNDPYLVIGAEKHDAGEAFPSYIGWIDEIRFSKILRYTTNFSRPTAPFVTDPTTVALYHLDEGGGNAVNDSSGFPWGPSNGIRMYGGSPAGPKWSTDIPFDNLNQELIKNTSLEKDKDDDGIPNAWTVLGLTALDKLNCTVAHSGSCSFQIIGEGLNKHIRQSYVQSGPAGDVFSLTAWSMSSDARGIGLYAVRMTIRYQDGTRETFKARFNNGSNNWQRREILATMDKPYDKIVIYLVYRKSQGQVWFDDISLIKQ